MSKPVYRVLVLLCEIVQELPIGTNLGVLHLLWTILSGQLLVTRGAILPALMLTGIGVGATWRAWSALAKGRWHPRLQNCPTKHYLSQAGKALPAIPFGVIGRVGAVAGKRWAHLVGIVRADPPDPSEPALQRRTLRHAVALSTPQAVTVTDRGFPLAAWRAAGKASPRGAPSRCTKVGGRGPGAGPGCGPCRGATRDT